MYLSIIPVLLFINLNVIFGGEVIVQRTVEMKLNGFSITEFVSNHGYPIEFHANIETEDGYLLDMFRIPHGKINGDLLEGPRPVIFLMHGLLGSAENWVISGPEKGLGFLLADRGYDVWMGNARGSVHSRKHIFFSHHSRDFWQFSWHEIGIYDLPAKINYIVEKTSQREIVYIGHSQGTTAFMVMASEKPIYNAHIKLMIAMAPVAYMSDSPHPDVRFMSLFARGIRYISNVIGFGQFLPNNEILNIAGQAICRQKAMFQEICSNIIFLATGYDSVQLERSMLPLIFQTNPAGASSKQFYHYGQTIRTEINKLQTSAILLNEQEAIVWRKNSYVNEMSENQKLREFRRFDYGPINNLIMYGTALPPLYNLSLISAPMCLFYGSNDWLISTEDVRRLSGQLSNVVLDYLIPYEAFNHLDFLYAKDVVSLLYVKIYEIIEKHVII